jgi:hypothetical protein
MKAFPLRAMARLAVILPGDRGPHFTFRTGRRAPRRFVRAH